MNPYKCPNCGSGAVITRTGEEPFTHFCRMCNLAGDLQTFSTEPKAEPEINTCERCQAPDADYVANPYQKEINDVERMEWLCSVCYKDIQGDI